MSARQVTSHTSHVRASIMFMFICYMFMWLHAFSSEHCPTVPRLCYDCVYCSLRKTRGRTQSCTMCMGHGRLVRWRAGYNGLAAGKMGNAARGSALRAARAAGQQGVVARTSTVSSTTTAKPLREHAHRRGDGCDLCDVCARRSDDG